MATETAWDWWKRAAPTTHLTSTGIAFLDVGTERVVELYGASKTGKTTTLRTLAARTVVSCARIQVFYFCENTHCDDVMQLATMIQSLLWKELASNDAEWEGKLQDCLRRIHISAWNDDDASGGRWLPILETLPQQIAQQDVPIVWLWDDWGGLSPREVRQVEWILCSVRTIALVGTAIQKTGLFSAQSIHLERINHDTEAAEAEYRATLDFQENAHFPYSISATSGILS